MSTDERDEMAEFFSQELGNLELKVNDGAWDAIEKQLDEEKKRGIFWWWKGAAVAGVAGILGFSLAQWMNAGSDEMALQPGTPAQVERVIEQAPVVAQPSPQKIAPVVTESVASPVEPLPVTKQIHSTTPSKQLEPAASTNVNKVLDHGPQKEESIGNVANQDAVAENNVDSKALLADQPIELTVDSTLAPVPDQPDIPSVVVVKDQNQPTLPNSLNQPLEPEEEAKSNALSKWAMMAYYQAYGEGLSRTINSSDMEVSSADPLAYQSGQRTVTEVVEITTVQEQQTVEPVYEDVYVYEVVGTETPVLGDASYDATNWSVSGDDQSVFITTSAFGDTLGNETTLGDGFSFVNLDTRNGQGINVVNVNVANVVDSVIVDTVQVISGYAVVRQDVAVTEYQEVTYTVIPDIWVARDTTFNLPVTFAAKVAYRPARRWSVETGLSYSVNRAEVNWVNDYRAQSNKETISTHLLGIPLSLRFDYVLKPRLQLYAITETSAARSIKSQRSWDFADDVKAKDKVEGVQFRATLGQGVNIPVAKQLGVYAEGCINRVGATKDVAVVTAIRRNGWWPSVQTGIRWDL